jgi:hypothetical protein
MSPIRQALYTKLATTGAITSQLSASDAIYHAQAPTGAKYPYLIFHKQAGTKTHAFGATAFKKEVWLVRAVDRNTTSNLAEAISEACDAVLDGGSLTVTGKTLADLRHVGDVDYLEVSGDQQFRHHGATYRITVT